MVATIPPAQTGLMENMMSLVNLELGNRMERGYATAVGDAVTSMFLVTPPFRYLINDADFAITVNDVDASGDGSMDFDTDIWTFDPSAIPAKPASIMWMFNFVYWPDAQVFSAVNAGITMLFPEFYVPEIEDVTSDGSSTDYTLTTPNIEEVRSVRVASSGTSYSRLRPDKYEADRDGSDVILHFASAPASGTMKVHLVTRQDQLASRDDSITLPVRAVPAIISYACYHLLNQSQAPRLRSDIAVATVGGGNLSPRQMNDASNSFYLRFQMSKAANRMRPWISR